MEDKITLDKTAFKALASETRVALLKSLDKRRKTASELAKEFGVSVQAISEHLNKLVEAELTQRVETGRKWVYFELTEKGRALVHPERTKFWVLLGVSLLAVVAGFGRTLLTMFSTVSQKAAPAAAGIEGAVGPSPAAPLAKGMEEAFRTTAADATAQASPVSQALQAAFSLNSLEIVLVVVGAAVFLASAYFLLRRSVKRV